MRDFLDGILEFIGAESLTDDEFETVDDSLEATYTVDTYEALRDILEARELVSGMVKRLTDYFTSHGVDLNPGAIPTPTSNILIGGPL